MIPLLYRTTTVFQLYTAQTGCLFNLDGTTLSVAFFSLLTVDYPEIMLGEMHDHLLLWEDYLLLLEDFAYVP